MPNTFKLATKLNMTTSGGSASNKTIYTAPVPSGGSLEVMAGNKLILESSDILKAYASASTSCDCALSYMEIT